MDWFLYDNGLRHESVKRDSEFSSFKIELRKMTSHFELLTQNFLKKLFFRVTEST